MTHHPIRRPIRRPIRSARRRTVRVAAVACAAALIAAACGGDDDDAGTDTTAPAGDTTAGGTAPSATTGPAATTAGGTGDAAGTVEGCGDGAATDPADDAPDRAPARCDPGAPAAQPLDEPASIVVSTGFTAEFVAPLLLAQSMGEFEKENLEVEIVTAGFSDALPQIASGRVDVAIGGAEAGWYNAFDQGIEAKWIMGNFSPPDAGDNSVPQTGLWVRKDAFSDPADPDLSEMKGKKIASAVGLGSVIAYPIAEAFAESGTSLLDLDVQEIPSTDMITALENGAVEGAWLLDPYWIDAAANDDLQLVATQAPGEPLGGYWAGPRLLEEEPEVGQAFVRAMVRTINTHLDGDYQSDPDVMAALAEATDTPEESLAATPALIFDWEIREGTTDRTQQYFIEFGTVEYDEPFPESDVVDRSLYLAAVGQEQ